MIRHLPGSRGDVADQLLIHDGSLLHVPDPLFYGKIFINGNHNMYPSKPDLKGFLTCSIYY
jgi:hypothetical protein